MMHPMLAAVLACGLALGGALPAVAQDAGGVRLRGQADVLDRLDQADRSGCRMSQTSVTVGVNRATARGAQARQQLVTDGTGGCRPLVSTQVTAGVNLAFGPRSQAEQSIDARAPRGLLATTNVARGVNLAAGSRSAAGQRIFAETVR